MQVVKSLEESHQKKKKLGGTNRGSHKKVKSGNEGGKRSLHAEAFGLWKKELVLEYTSEHVKCLQVIHHPCIPEQCLFVRSLEYKMPHRIPQDLDNKVPHTASLSRSKVVAFSPNTTF